MDNQRMMYTSEDVCMCEKVKKKIDEALDELYQYAKQDASTWTIVNKKDTIFKYIFWERLDSLPIPESCFHFVWCQIA